MKVIISGGGTGGHIFPALSIAGEIRRRMPEAEILFVGAVRGMEMRVVPEHGYEIKEVWISGLHRKVNLRNLGRNLLFPLKLITSLIQANGIVKRFSPDLVVGVGGFASAPVGRVAAARGIPLFICEQNAYPGLVNRWLARYATKILLGNEAASRYFPAEKVRITGNPIRAFAPMDRETAAGVMNLDPAKPAVLSVGGSLGAQRLNQALLKHIAAFPEAGIQLLWQCGSRYYDTLKGQVPKVEGVQLRPFIKNMGAAYQAVDLVISRAGGSTISELIAMDKPAILVPSPNVAEDHQTQNARSLADKGAALLVADAEAEAVLVPTVIEVLQDPARFRSLQDGIRQMEKHDAARLIVDKLFET